MNSFDLYCADGCGAVVASTSSETLVLNTNIICSACSQLRQAQQQDAQPTLEEQLAGAQQKLNEVTDTLTAIQTSNPELAEQMGIGTKRIGLEIS